MLNKINKTFDLFGCSQSFPRKWMLYQLLGNMAEENYGSVWSIDQFHPLSKTIYLTKMIFLNLQIGLI